MTEDIVRSGSLSRVPLRFWHAAARRPLVASLGLLAAISLILTLFPSLDLVVSRHFYQPSAGFAAGSSTFLEGLRNAGGLIEWIFALGAVAPLLIKIVFPHRPLLLPPRVTLFVVATFVLGPGLIVNGILKDHWGRARPRTVLEFGGEAVFTPAWWISNQCARNCSFVSGEAAAAFCLVALVFLVRPKRRPATAAATLAFAAVVSFTRVAVGAHFLSDVLIAWLITLCVMIALNKVVLEGLPPEFDRAVRRGAIRAGEALQGLAGRRPGGN